MAMIQPLFTSSKLNTVEILPFLAQNDGEKWSIFLKLPRTGAIFF